MVTGGSANDPNLGNILPASPSMHMVHNMLSHVLDNPKEKIHISFRARINSPIYKLEVEFDPVSHDPIWQFFQAGDNAANSLWKYHSTDTLLVYNKLLTSIGEEVQRVHLSAQMDKAQAQAQVQSQSQVQNQAAGAADAGLVFYYAPTSKEELDKTTPMPAFSNPTALAERSTVLNGDLAFIQITTLLQSLQLAKMTGRLQIDSKEGAAEVFFLEGKPVHCSVPNSSGNEGVYELMAWQEGKFFFQPQVVTKKRTLTEALDNLVIQGVQLLDKLNYLKNIGYREDSVLTRVEQEQELNPNDLEDLLSVGDPDCVAAQRKIYSSVDGSTESNKLFKSLGLSRSQWVPAVNYMIRAKLITIGGGGKTTGELNKLSLKPKAVDNAAIQSVMMTLRRPDTGMFNYAAFLYFLEQEYFRGHRSGTPLSVIVFDMRIKSGVKEIIREPMPAQALNEAVFRISNTKRQSDLLAHYEGFDYALICPNTKGEGAKVLARRILKAMAKSPLTSTISIKNLDMRFGIACIPEDFLELGLLLSAAEAARNKAAESENDQETVLYRDIW